MKKILLALCFATLLAFGHGAVAAESTSSTSPKTVIHIVTVKWKDGTTAEQIKAALDGARALPARYKGITHVWTNAIKVQGDKTHVIVMEFANEKALADYTDSDAQKEWYKVYLDIRGQSTTFDVTN
jgi:hypothetical protein